MEDKIEKVYLETRLRNLKRRYAKLAQHADLADMAVEVEMEINNIESMLQ